MTSRAGQLTSLAARVFAQYVLSDRDWHTESVARRAAGAWEELLTAREREDAARDACGPFSEVRPWQEWDDAQGELVAKESAAEGLLLALVEAIS